MRLGHVLNLMNTIFPGAKEAGYLEKFRQFMLDLSKHPHFFQFFPPCHSSIMGGPQAKLNFITPSQILSPAQELLHINDFRSHHPGENALLNIWKPLCIGINLQRPQRRSRANPKPKPIPPAWIPGFLDNRPPGVKKMLEDLLLGITEICPAYKPPKRRLESIFSIAIQDKNFLSDAYKKLYLRTQQEPPARLTRLRDNVAAPTKTDFIAAFAAVKNNTQMDSRSRTHVLEVLNRTVLTPALRWRMQIDTDEPFCTRQCGVIADAQHLQLECDGGFLATEMLLEFFHHNYPEAKITPRHLQFHTPAHKMSHSFNSQYLHLLATISKTLFALPYHPRYTHWQTLHFYAKLLSTISALVVLRKNCRWSFKLIDKFKDYFTSRLPSLDEYSFGIDTSHFRRVPRTLDDLRSTRRRQRQPP